MATSFASYNVFQYNPPISLPSPYLIPPIVVITTPIALRFTVTAAQCMSKISLQK